MPTVDTYQVDSAEVAPAHDGGDADDIFLPSCEQIQVSTTFAQNIVIVVIATLNAPASLTFLTLNLLMYHLLFCCVDQHVAALQI